MNTMQAQHRTTRAMAITMGLGLAVGLAGTARGQMPNTGWFIDIDNPVLAPVGHASGLPQSATITVIAKFDSSTDYAFAGGGFDFIASELGVAGVNWRNAQLIAPLAGPGTTAGVVEPFGASGILAGQLHFPPAGIFGDPSNPIAAWQIEYTATDFTPRLIDVETQTTGFFLYIDQASGASRSVLPGSLMEGLGQLQVIPAPGSLALLALGALAGAPRRRR